MVAKLVALASLVAVAGFAVRPGQQEAAPAASAESHKVARGDLQIRVEFEGTFVPVNAAPVTCTLHAYQGELTVAEVAPHGGAVKKGDVILRLDSKIDQQIESATHAVASAEAGAEKAAEELRLAERGDRLALEGAQRQAAETAKNLELFEKVDMPLEMREADQNVQRYEDSIDDQREELDQLEKMYRSEELTNATAEIVVKRARRQLQRILAELEMTKERTKRTKEHDLPAQHAQLKAAAEEAAHSLEVVQKTAPLARVEKEVAAAQSRLELAEQKRSLEKMRADKEALVLRAPMDGILYYGTCELGRWSGTAEAVKALKPGEAVQASQVTLMVIAEGLDVHVSVKEADLHLVAAGLEATVNPVAFPLHSWSGKTEEPALLAGADGAFDMLIRSGVAAKRLVAGMKAKVVVQAVEIKDVLLVPAPAVTEQDGRKWVTKKGSDKPTEVKTGRSDGKMIEILEGVQEGDEIVVPPKQ
ncbi:MAG: hypothetical protein HYY16_15650 [Planctomycetes bacterium]|nr:hypothetical protein [Planctomycetota bacterium]